MENVIIIRVQMKKSQSSGQFVLNLNFIIEVDFFLWKVANFYSTGFHKTAVFRATVKVSFPVDTEIYLK